ncbi:Permease of the drug/metabolite transporter (DMT) superfamily [Hyphomicrobiales bacterium]|nr:Permease of the drug/metabolite transporter (DMT) superfamily [Hyphomicrobiales bacterium]CAH1692281.1 Permease of the drug/metabolite transporter (DMT) superfamily [Hyphomicrobiales bacterium]
MERLRQSWTLAIGAGVLAALIWSSWYVLARHGVTGGGLRPEDLAALRFMVAAPVSLLLLRRIPISRRNLPYTVVMAIGVGPAFGIVVAKGFQVAPASFGGAMTAVCGVLLSLIGAVLLLGERLSRRQWLGIVITVLGLAVLALISGGSIMIGYFLCGGLLWAAYGVAARASGLKAMEAAGAVAMLSAVFFLPPYFYFAGDALWQADAGELWLQGIGQGILTGTVALALHAYAVVVLGAARGALFQSLVPPFTLILSLVFLWEVPSRAEVLTIMLTLIGVATALHPSTVKGDRKACGPFAVSDATRSDFSGEIDEDPCAGEASGRLQREDPREVMR